MTARTVFLLLALACLGCDSAPDASVPTFNRDVAPIVFSKCALCHHPDGPAPFPLTTYREVEKRAEQIVKVTSSHYMPPWLPERADFDLEGVRTLTDNEKAKIVSWVEKGKNEGVPGDLTTKPEWSKGWHRHAGFRRDDARAVDVLPQRASGTPMTAASETDG